MVSGDFHQWLRGHIASSLGARVLGLGRLELDHDKPCLSLQPGSSLKEAICLQAQDGSDWWLLGRKSLQES